MHRNIDCDMGNNTGLFYDAQRWSRSEHDNVRSKPSGNVSLFAQKASRGGTDRCYMCDMRVAEMWVFKCVVILLSIRGQVFCKTREFYLI